MKKIFSTFRFIVNVVFFIAIVGLLISYIPERNHIGMIFLVYGLLIVIVVEYYFYNYDKKLRRKSKMYNLIKNAMESKLLDQKKEFEIKTEKNAKLIASLDDALKYKVEEYNNLKEKINEANQLYLTLEKSLRNLKRIANYANLTKEQKAQIEKLLKP